MNDQERCAACKEPTKRPVGFWDGIGKHGELTGGFLYSCNSETCDLAIERRKAEAEAAERRRLTALENERNGIDLGEFRDLRREYRVSLHRLSQISGVSAPTLSNWEKGREPFPLQEYNRLIGLICIRRE